MMNYHPLISILQYQINRTNSQHVTSILQISITSEATYFRESKESFFSFKRLKISFRHHCWHQLLPFEFAL